MTVSKARENFTYLNKKYKVDERKRNERKE